MIQLVTPPNREVLTVAEAKLYLQVTHNAQDLEIQAQLAAARRWIEARTWRTLLPSTLRLTLDRFPMSRVIYLPRPRLISVTSITYHNTSGGESAVDLGRVVVDASSEPARLQIDENDWPETADRLAAVRIEYVAGWQASEIPEDLVLAVKLLLGSWYDNRHAGGWTRQAQLAAENLVQPHRCVVPHAIPSLLGKVEDLDAESL